MKNSSNCQCQNVLKIFLRELNRDDADAGFDNILSMRVSNCKELLALAGRMRVIIISNANALCIYILGD